MLWRAIKKKKRISGHPNQQHTPNKVPTELRRRNFVTKPPTEHANRRPNVQKTCAQRVRIPTEPPFCIPLLVVGIPMHCNSVIFFSSS